MSRLSGRGDLFFPDGREAGAVDYDITHVPLGPRGLGEISGRLRRVVPLPSPDFPFWEFCEPGNGPGALRLEDGRWLLCALQPDGEFKSASELLPPGEQPKR